MSARLLFVTAAAIAAATLYGTTSDCQACSVPVFRYALEKWFPDHYGMTLFHRGPLTEAQQQLLSGLKRQTSLGLPLANVKVIEVDLDQNPSAELQALWDAQPDRTTPLLVVQSPARRGPAGTVWAGELTPQNVELLQDSATRRSLAERLLRGDSVVWILLEGGQKSQDDQAFLTLEQELARLQTTLTLPELAEEDVRTLGIEPDSLSLVFSAMRLSRSDPAEAPLVQMLLNVEPDLRDPEYAGKPMAFPVFGRGRVLHALVGAGISADTIRETSQFLTGACQCTVKQENPGVDLLMSLDWDSLIDQTPTREHELPPLAGLTGFTRPEPAGATPAESLPPAIASPAAAASDLPAQESTNRVASAESPLAIPVTAPTSVSADRQHGQTITRNVMLVVLVLGFSVVGMSLVLGRRQA